MELQWPLILFTTFIAASAGLFGVQGCYAIAGRGAGAQMRALVTSFVLMVVGGVAVLFHLQHGERIFNGFGHLTSGITQELIFIVIMFLVMVAFFIYLKRGSSLPKWLGVLAVVVAVALVCVMGHSYLMPSRPAWDSVAQVLSLVGAAWAMGAGMFAALDAHAEADFKAHGISMVAGTAVAVALTVVYLVAMVAATGSFMEVGNYFDPTHPNAGMNAASGYSPFAPQSVGFSLASIVLALAALVIALAAKKKGGKWAACGWAVAVCSFAAAILLRIVFYNAGGTVFMFY